MTRDEFISMVPGAIEHESQRYCELNIIIDASNAKGACYQDRTGETHGESYGPTWEAVYENLVLYLKNHNYIKTR